MADKYWVGGTGDTTDTAHWSLTAGGAGGAGAPSATEQALFQNSSGSGTATVVGSLTCSNLITTAYTGTIHCANGNSIDLGNGSGAAAIIFDAGTTLTGDGLITALSSGGGQITCAGLTIPWHVSITNSGAGTWTLNDNFASAGDFTIDAVLTANNKNVTCRKRLGASTLTLGSGIWTLTGSGTVWATPTAITANSSTIKLTDSSSTSKTFQGNGKTYNNIWFTGGGAGAFIVTGSNTFADIKRDTPPQTLKFTAGTTTTFTSATGWSGTAGNLMTLGSVTAAQHTLSCVSGVVTSNYSSISYSNAGGGATFNAQNATDGGNNAGWNFLGSGDGLFYGSEF